MSVTDIEKAIEQLPPDDLVQLDAWYREFQKTNEVPSRDVWQVLSDAAGMIDAPSDWASQHNHYLYGTPKTE